MIKNKYLALFVVTVILCLTLVACSSDESIYNESFTENPSYEVIHGYNIAQGDFVSLISDVYHAESTPTE